MSDGEWRIDAEFPGGNIVVARTGPDWAEVRQDLRDTEGWWFWWQFRVRGAEGRTLTFRHVYAKETVKGRFPIGRRGPAVSVDGGATWSWMGAESVTTTDCGAEFRFTFPAGAEDVRFAFAQPYVDSDLQRFLARHAANPGLARRELCRSRAGRPVHVLYAGCLNSPRTRVLVTARHHCCESLAGFEIEGLIEAALDDSELGRWFRSEAEMMIVPFIDTDGVQNGDQGKNRRPRDHGRDYEGESIYPETRALRELAPEWSGGKLRVALDLHCPAIRDRVIQIVGSRDPAMWEQQRRFARILEESATGPLPYRAADNLPFGQSWNVDANYVGGMSFSRWAAGLPGVALAAGLEFPYAEARDVAITADGARAFGRTLAAAVKRYLEAGAGERSMAGA
jgi:hypothetical protein